jgi:hypothetical protein
MVRIPQAYYFLAWPRRFGKSLTVSTLAALFDGKKDKVYIIELKCNQTAAVAIKQIRDKGYHKKYVQSGRAIHLLGINFDTTKREITDWRKEDV